MPNRVRFTGFYMSMSRGMVIDVYICGCVRTLQYIGFDVQNSNHVTRFVANWSMDDSSALVTGSLWGKPTWGTYWVWDARLTTEPLLFIYLGL